MGCDQAAYLPPVAKLGDLERGRHREPRRGLFGRLWTLDIGEVHDQLGLPAGGADPRPLELAPADPSHRHAGRPDLADVEAADRTAVDEREEALAAKRQRAAAPPDRESEVEHVADFQALGLHHRGERAVQHRRFEIILAA